MIDGKVTYKINVPNLNLTKEFERAAATVIADMKRGIRERMDVTGNPFPELEASTINKKGHDQPLVDMNVLRRDHMQKTKGVNHVIIKFRGKGEPPRDEVAFILQVKGVKQKDGSRKHFLHFGISDRAKKKIWADIKRGIQKRIRQARIR